jgi:hypothetical protein
MTVEVHLDGGRDARLKPFQFHFGMMVVVVPFIPQALLDASCRPTPHPAGDPFRKRQPQ